MADLLKWFKVWTAINSDDDFEPVTEEDLADIGRWTLLGAMTAEHGTKGVLEIRPETLNRLTLVRNLDELRCKKVFKNVSFEEGKNRYGKVTVTWAKWSKFQVDSTAALRQKTSRLKRRGEERRREENNNGAKPRAVSLPEDRAVYLNDKIRAWARSRGFRKPDDLVEKFEEDARAKGKKFIDWYSAFQTWIRNDAEWRPIKRQGGFVG